jgi:hypothetical protein
MANRRPAVLFGTALVELPVGDVLPPTVLDLSGKADRNTVTYSAPATGQTTTINSAGEDQTVHLDHSSAIAAHTLVFPTNATSRVGQKIRIFARTAVTTLTINANGNTIRGVALTTLAASGTATFEKTAPSMWIRLP